ncbi:glycosyltransferase [Mangrovimicrobium sediminis]|uniref:glycosyltransferase n=1 Tax=Mangrovimicrobium sediminis TaxID=2562682 RepID=UPI00197D96EB|nr:glycosyltransferase [Haliea sp. SAOS-164]
MVAIGRNEGERFRRCVESLAGIDAPKVYVDSSSTDDSVELAQQNGLEVVELNLSTPFTAGRARNEGFARLLQIAPDTEYIIFLDGDCSIEPGWVETALAAFAHDPQLAITCGRRRELHPEASLYNQLCDLEWDTPIGEAAACGGDFIARRQAFEAVGGFDPAVIAGEEPEMCFRLRSAGWSIQRLDHAMTAHDADMHRFGQYWQRSVRCGHAYAQGFALHGASDERYYHREIRSLLAWGLGIPLLVVALAFWQPLLAGLLLLAYPLMWLKIYRSERRRAPQFPRRVIACHALFLLLGKFAQLAGAAKYLRTRLQRGEFRIIEYK